MQLYAIILPFARQNFVKSILLPFRRGARIELIGVLLAAFEMDVMDMGETHERSLQ
jgi:hypothetical protein